MKKVLITGITGQDGSYLAKFLLFEGYKVQGIICRVGRFNAVKIGHISKDIQKLDIRFLHYAQSERIRCV